MFDVISENRKMTEKTELATFGAGCFWGVQAAFDELEGVLKTQAGYLGGHVENPTYQQVCQDNTGHAEVVQITYDPQRISYQELLERFWQLHDPTQKNRQGPDVGSQYRSAIFTHSETQRQQAEASRAALQASGRYDRPIVTEITPASQFYPAEEYHQHYLKKKGLGSCHL